MVIETSSMFSLAIVCGLLVACVILLPWHRDLLVHWTSKLLPRIVEEEIISLRVYPIKSCRGIEVQSTRLLQSGLDLDRNWMWISRKTREFITIRTDSRMTLITTGLDTDEDRLTIKYRDIGIDIPAHPTKNWLEENTQLTKAIIWGQETDAWEYSGSLTRPIADALGIDMCLVFKGPSPRVLRGCGAPKSLGRVESTKFADMMPIQISSMASLKELNERLSREGEDNIDIERFRPNIIVRGHDPWVEDQWKSLSIHAHGMSRPINLDVVCRCLRCHVPNVDPATAEKHSRQPWKELMKYRRIDRGLPFKPGFGMLCVPQSEGLVTTGMMVKVTETTNDHFFINPMK